MERTLSSKTALLPTQFPRRAWYLRAAAVISTWARNARTRRQLAALDERQLADAGITLCDRENELDKPFWR